jgi:hypothetical protein
MPGTGGRTVETFGFTAKLAAIQPDKTEIERLGLSVTDIDAELRVALAREKSEPYAIALSEYLDVPVPDWLISDSLADHTGNDACPRTVE